MTKPSAIIKVSDKAPRKKYVPSTILAILSLVLAFFAGVTPASAAASFCCEGSLTPTATDPSIVTLSVTSYETVKVPVTVIVEASSANGSSQQVFTVEANPGFDSAPDDPTNPVEPTTTTYPDFPTFTVPAGATISAYIGPTLLDAYTNTSEPPLRQVTPAAPTQQGNTVTIPSATADYLYVDANGTPYSLSAQIPTDGSVLIYPRLQPGVEGVELTITEPWIFSYQAPQQAIPPQVSKTDLDGTENDELILGAGVGFSNPVVNGVAYQPGTYPAAPLVDGKGCIAVQYTVLEGFSYRFGTTYDTKVCYSEATLPPADDTETKLVWICHATESDTKVFEKIQVSVASIIMEAGHSQHQGGLDKIPSFDYTKAGVAGSFPGQNWDQAFFDNGCKTVTQEPTPTDKPTETAKPTPTETVNPTPTEPGTTSPSPTETSSPAPTASVDVSVTVVEKQVTKTRSHDVDTAAVGAEGQGMSATQAVLLLLSVALLGLAIALFPRRKQLGAHR